MFHFSTANIKLKAKVKQKNTKLQSACAVLVSQLCTSTTTKAVYADQIYVRI